MPRFVFRETSMHQALRHLHGIASAFSVEDVTPDKLLLFSEGRTRRQRVIAMLVVCYLRREELVVVGK